MIIRIEVARRDDHFGVAAAVRALFIDLRKSYILAFVLAKTPATDTIDTENVATIAQQTKRDGFLKADSTGIF